MDGMNALLKKRNKSVSDSMSRQNGCNMISFFMKAKKHYYFIRS